MRKILILYPHFPPSNLAGVHRPRLFAQHLHSLGWQPVVLTVHEQYYEEALDPNLLKLLPADLRVEKVGALPISRPRLIGDIGLRAFFQLYRRAKQLIRREKIDFLFISIPSFYCSLLVRWLHVSTGIAYGIDYIDPWVHRFPGSDRHLSRHWFSTRLARLLEPVAVKKAALITGVAEAYYKPVLERNPRLKNTVLTGAMPYGGEARDFEILETMHLQPYLFERKEGLVQLVYAGAMMPRSYGALESIFRAMAKEPDAYSKVEFHFIGTGSRANDAGSYNIKPLAEKYGLWQHPIFEYPKRIPYLDVLVHLQAAGGVFILGSSEPHYTPSKSYQAILSGRPILAVLHEKSSAVPILEESGAAVVLPFDGESDLLKIENEFEPTLNRFMKMQQNFDEQVVNHALFEKYSAFEVTRQLALLLDKVVSSPVSQP